MLNRKSLTSIITKLTNPKSNTKAFSLLLLFLLLLSIAIISIYFIRFREKVYPGVYIAGVPMSGFSQSQAETVLKESLKVPEKIVLVSGEQNFEIPLNSIDFQYNLYQTTENALSIYRTGNLINNLQDRLKAFWINQDLKLIYKLNQEKLSENLSVIAGQIAIPPTRPSVSLVNNKVVVNQGKSGIDVDINLLEKDILYSLSLAKHSPIIIPSYEINPTLTDEEVKVLYKRGENLLEKSLIFSYEDIDLEYDTADIFVLLNPRGGYLNLEIATLVDEISQEIDRNPENPVFIFINNKVQEFSPALNGLETNKDQLTKKVLLVLNNLESNKEEASVIIEIPVEITPPDYQTEDVNNLGIKELIGKGTSRFRGSISSRIHNIAVASSRFNGVLIAPDEIFSFNASLGDVSEYTGYKQAYIIKDGKTVLGDGGGVCQVSTTLFRAILDAGLPVIERRAHAYRVAYYEQDSLPGMDATVYAPTTDLKFKNDTPGHILIQTFADTKNASLTFEIYGTSDSRIASTSKPIVTDVVPPPEDLYVDDPALPEGEIKQIDWKAWGAKVWFDYEVEKEGEVIYEKRFYSNFRPWQSIFLRGTGPIGL